MLARAARRKLRRDAFASPDLKFSGQLTLPWLCPAQMRWAASVGTITHDVARKPKLPTSPRHESTRSLATAADLQPTQFAPYPPPQVPQSSLNGFSPPWAPSVPHSDLARLTPWDPSKPLVIHDSLSTATPCGPVRYGIGGDPIELHQNLHACVRVGRLDRAMAIVQRLTDMYSPSAPEVVDAHNVFLKAKLEAALQNPLADSMADIEEWYRTRMVQKALEPNAQTFITLLRASLTLQEPGLQEESIRKYLAQARDCGPDVLDEVNGSPEYTDTEWETLIKAQPDLFEEPPTVEETQEIQMSTPAGRASLIRHGLLPDPALALKSVSQKGLGLDTIKQALNQFEQGEGVPYPHEMPGSPEEKDKAWAYMRQIRLESDSTKAAVDRWKAEDTKLKEMGIHGVLQSKPIQALMWNWYSALLPVLEKEIQMTKDVMSAPSANNASDHRHIYGPYLEQCSAEKLAALTISKVITSCARGGPRDDATSLKISVLSVGIGRDIENEINLSVEQRTGKFVRSQRNRTRKDLLKRLRKITKAKALLASQSSGPVVEAPSDAMTQAEFPLHIKTKIGAIALEKLLQAATITVTAEDPKTGKQLFSTQPAFHHHTGFHQGKRIGWISPHHEIMTKLRGESVHGIAMVKLPMLIEPKPWTAFDEGGYYTMREFAVRTKVGDNAQTAYAHSAITHGDMEKVLAGLDVLGKVPWVINSDVYRVAAEAWNRGEGVGKLVPEKFSLTRPSEPAADASPAERKQWLKDMKEYENAMGGFHSQRCFQNFQLEVARAFIHEKNIYFPHSVDFRGRAYPVPPLLNHIGADLSRGLLKFGNGKELGAVGLQWLKIHLANLYGFDKASLRDREKFAMTNLNEIYDSATNPLGGRRWWTKAEDPWQCLACCIELKNALDSPDPTRYVSNLPIHQDGTCNGLQHYAALGGDQAGASQVNLEPADKPQDIYSGVAELVQEMIAKDAADGNAMAQFMNGKVTRKVVKRTVMTNVYGVTFMGAKLQVFDELRDMFPNFQGTEGVPQLTRVAMYIVTKIFKALGKIFNGAQEIQYWLGECGDRITTSISPEQIKKIRDLTAGKAPTYDPKYKTPKKMTSGKVASMNKALGAYKTSIIWTTPLKMPVVQPYRKDSLQTIKTSLQSISVTRRSSTGVVDRRKQLQAFPPNFIHSLDATHMLLSALKCNEMGLDFAAVHDSFWTHAADIPNLNIILRDAFVRMHSEDIMGRLGAEFKARYAGSMYCAHIIGSSKVAMEITAWRRSYREKRGLKLQGRFGAAPVEEITLEAERQELLNSENEEDRQKGQEMVTPTSIWLAAKDPLSMSSFRLALLGDTQQQSSSKLESLKEKVLGAEAEAMRSEDDASVTLSGPAEEKEESSKRAKKGKSASTRSAAVSRIQVWLPLTFPPVPKKGDWDVKRLRESKYFFS
ncbi:DNA-directed RNA polymerase mitochondrial precursor [Melanomma pulvis-pyrius CBS 109.77]|uniref:DNA-directed RNA polymerase n=1 Tax=Melanomma pulvis-pyrius CBS 109.77 TaxID=1314802 RepID=A0A6A6WY70_9PLEO|nr:DNA-directed RNA polymerase mitochondrial precursor [Melanomma pulvis-pyrius CBS 109.77]